jgi:vacuolar-type H+-ATPase subunit C/Vma6
MTWHDISALINPLGSKSAEELALLASKSSVRGFLSELGFFSHYGAEKVYGEYESEGRLEVLESFFDAVFLRDFIRELEGTVFDEYAKVNADVLNIKNLIVCRSYGIDAAPYLADSGFSVSDGLLKKASRSELEEFQSLFSNTPYADLVSSAVRGYQKEKTLSFIENMTRAYLLRHLKDNAMLRPLSIYPAIYFMERKVGEIKTLKAIILSKKEGFTPEETKKIVSGVEG